jgi:hypothetical protein
LYGYNREIGNGLGNKEKKLKKYRKKDYDKNKILKRKKEPNENKLDGSLYFLLRKSLMFRTYHPSWSHVVVIMGTPSGKRGCASGGFWPARPVFLVRRVFFKE